LTIDQAFQHALSKLSFEDYSSWYNTIRRSTIHKGHTKTRAPKVSQNLTHREEVRAWFESKKEEQRLSGDDIEELTDQCVDWDLSTEEAESLVKDFREYLNQEPQLSSTVRWTWEQGAPPAYILRVINPFLSHVDRIDEDKSNIRIHQAIARVNLVRLKRSCDLAADELIKTGIKPKRGQSKRSVVFNGILKTYKWCSMSKRNSLKREVCAGDKF
jgi:hypothetical protein